MDKQTLSNYGWLVIVTLILAIMLALATPFGTYVGDGVVSISNGFVGTTNSATNEDSIDQSTVEWGIKADHGIDYKTYKYFDNIHNAMENKNESNKLKNDTVVIAYAEDKTPIIRFIRSCEINSPITVNGDLIIDTNDCNIILTNETGFVLNNSSSLTIIGSGTIIHKSSSENRLTTIDATNTTSSSINLIKTNFVSNTTASGNYFINTFSGDAIGTCNVKIEDCNIDITSIDESLYGIRISEYSTLDMKNTKINTSTNKGFSLSVYSKGNMTAKNCEINANSSGDSTYIAYNSSGNLILNDCKMSMINKDGVSNGVFNYNGYMELNNCSTYLENTNFLSTDWEFYAAISNSGTNAITNINGGSCKMIAKYGSDTTVCVSNVGGEVNINGGSYYSNNINTIEANTEGGDMEADNFSYTIQTQDTTGISNVKNAIIVAEGTNSQVTPFRIQNGATVNIEGCTITAKCTRTLEPLIQNNKDIFSYIYDCCIFLNAKIRDNTVNISNSSLNGTFAFNTNKQNQYIGENVQFNVSDTYKEIS